MRKSASDVLDGFSPIAKTLAKSRKAKTKTVKPKPITASQLYTGREVTIRHNGLPLKGSVSNGGQCDDNEFAFSGPEVTQEQRDNGKWRIEECVARSAIITLGK